MEKLHQILRHTNSPRGYNYITTESCLGTKLVIFVTTPERGPQETTTQRHGKKIYYICQNLSLEIGKLRNEQHGERVLSKNGGTFQCHLEGQSLYHHVHLEQHHFG